MKKAYKIILSVLLVLSFTQSAFCGRGPNVHTPQTPYNWYCRHTGDGTPPPCDAPLAFIREHNGVFRREGSDEKVIYLTFDLGYENGNTELIADALDRHHAQAAFFVLSHVITENTDLIRRLAESGHLICNHTASHKNMTRADRTAFRDELQTLEQLYSETLGFRLAPFYRPPEGTFTEENLDWAAEMGYTTVFWSFAYADWDNKDQPNPDRAFKKIMDNTHPGEIILLHPTSATNAAIMDRLLTEWEKMGYRFGSLNELVTKGDAQ